MVRPTLAEIGAWADELEPTFHGPTLAGCCCLLTWEGGWAVGLGDDLDASAARARANAFAIRIKHLDAEGDPVDA